MKIGPAFVDELAAADLLGLPFSWSADGTLRGLENLSTADRQAVEAVLTAHDPDVPSAEQIRIDDFRADAGCAALLDRLVNATPAQIDAYIDANVTNLAEARAFLKLLTKVIALGLRRDPPESA